jgi:Protein of unknown function (DUF3040)
VRQGWGGIVPLSEHEQRLLNEIEQALYAEDPKFASSVRSARPRNRARLLLAASILGVIAGLVVVVVGLTANFILLGVLGFVLIVGSLVGAISALRGPHSNGPVSLGGRGDARNNKQTGLRTKMEDRMRRRFDES